MRMSWLVLLAGLAVATPAYRAAAQQEVLDSLIRTALKNNPDLSAAGYLQQSTAEAARSAGVLPDPNLSVGVLSLPTNSFALDETPMSGVSVTLSQMIPWPGKLGARSALANARATQSTADAQAVRDRVVREVTDAYLDYSYWSKSLRIIQQYLDLLTATRDIAEVRYGNGDALAQDVLRAGTMLSRTQVRLLQAQQQRRSALLRLQRAVGDATISDQLQAGLADLPVDETDTASIDTSPLLKSSASVIEQAEARQRLARKSYWPDLMVGVDYRFRKDVMGDPVHGADFLSFKVGIDLPLWFMAKQKHDVRSADRLVLSAREHQRSVRDMLRARYDDALSSLSTTRQSLAQYDESLIPEASAAVEAARVAYEVGKVDFNALLSAQSDNFEVRIERLSLLRQYHQTRAALTELTGTAHEEVEK